MAAFNEISDEAKRLKVFRLEQEELGQDGFAEKLGIKRSALSKYETGRVTIPLDLVKKLHEHFNMSYQWFFTGKGSKKHIDGKTTLVTDIKTVITNQELLYNQVQSIKDEFMKLHREFYATKTQ